MATMSEKMPGFVSEGYYPHFYKAQFKILMQTLPLSPSLSPSLSLSLLFLFLFVCSSYLPVLTKECSVYTNTW